MNPLFFVGAAGVGLLLWESNSASNKLASARKSKTSRLPLASPVFSNLNENPFQQKEKIEAIKIQPTQQGLLDNPSMAGRWMLTLPGGAFVPIVCSFNRLKRKVLIVIPNHSGKVPAGLRLLEDDKYIMESAKAMSLFEQ